MSVGRLLELGADQIADLFAVDRLAGQASHDRLHHSAHVFEGPGAGFRDDGLDNSRKLLRG